MLTIDFPLPIPRTRPKSMAVAATTSPSGRPPRLARLLALAHRLDELVRNGTARNYRELAELGHVSPARLSRILVLMNLAPAIPTLRPPLPPRIRTDRLFPTVR